MKTILSTGAHMYITHVGKLIIPKRTTGRYPTITSAPYYFITPITRTLAAETLKLYKAKKIEI